MSGEVVPFRRPDDRTLLWVCNCGSTTHHHHANGAVECASCRNIASDLTGEWRERLPDAPDEASPLSSANFKVLDLGNAEAFLRRQLKSDPERARCIVRIDDDGGASTWADEIDTPEREAWLLRRLSEAFRRITQRRDD